MPCYDVKCTNKKCPNLNKVLEIFAPMDKEVLCEHCKQKMKRVWSGSVGIVFKGSGFHVNDYPS